MTTLSYNVDGQLQSVKSDDGVDDWTFTHDVNGNVVGVKMAENRVNVGFDGGDRIVSYGDLDFVSYDDRGFVVRRGSQVSTSKNVSPLCRWFSDENKLERLI